MVTLVVKIFIVSTFRQTHGNLHFSNKNCNIIIEILLKYNKNLTNNL